MSLFLLILVAIVALVVGAYSHKWLAKVTGAPANIAPTAQGIGSAAASVAETVVKKV
jgi:hypothetical protein